MALYHVATKHLAHNGTVVDLTPSGGKSTVILSAAAFRNGAKVVSLIDKKAIRPVEELWFNRAYKTFKLKDTCIAAEEITNMNADMVVVRGDDKLACNIFADGLKPDGILFGINILVLNGMTPEQSGNSWATWRKPKIKSLAETNPYLVNEQVGNKLLQESVRSSTAIEGIRLNKPIEDNAIITEEEALRLRGAQDG